MSTSYSQSQIGPYLLDREIGRGGMGVVYRAKHQGTGQVVALKMLLQPGQESHTRALLDEAITGKKLKHQSCLQSYEVLTYGPSQSPVIVTEYIDGMNLRDFLDSLKSEYPHFQFSPINATLILEQLFLGLRAAHKAGLIHQDIKPENYLIPQSAIDRLRIAFQDGQEEAQDALFAMRYSGWLKLSDWGLSILKERDRTSNSQSLSFTLSRVPEGKRGGTIVYMPLEQIDGVGISRRTDIFALSLIYYELLTGTAPINARSTAEGLDPHCFEDLQIYLIQMINSSAQSAIDPKKDSQLKHLKPYPRVQKLLLSMSMRQRNERIGSAELETELEELLLALEENPLRSKNWTLPLTALALLLPIVLWIAYSQSTTPGTKREPVAETNPNDKDQSTTPPPAPPTDPAPDIPPVKPEKPPISPDKPKPPEIEVKPSNPADRKQYSPEFLTKIRKGDLLATRTVKQVNLEIGRALGASTRPLLFLRNVESITVAGAKQLANYKGGIYIENLKTMTVEEATELIKFPGFSLTIGFTNPVDSSVFKALSQYHGYSLSLRYRPRLTKENAQALVSFKGQMFTLRGESPLDKESALVLATIKAKNLSLQDMVEVSDLTALALSQFSGSTLSFPKLSKLSLAAASALAASKAERLSFGALNDLNAKAAYSLAQFKGRSITLGLKSLDEALATQLAAFKGIALIFSHLPSLNSDAASALANSRAVSLNFMKLESIDIAAARDLAKFQGQVLAIGGKVKLGAEHGLALSQFTGSLIDLSKVNALDIQFLPKMVTFLGDLKVEAKLKPLFLAARKKFLDARSNSDRNLLKALKTQRRETVMAMMYMTREVAKELQSAPGQKLTFQSLQKLNFIQASHLARSSARSLHFPKLKALDAETKAALLRFKGSVTIRGKALLLVRPGAQE